MTTTSNYSREQVASCRYRWLAGTSATVLAGAVTCGAMAAAGDIDATFGNGGIVTTDIAGSPSIARDVAVQADGSILAAGDSGANLALARYNADGSLDTSFDGDGIVITDLSEQEFGNAVALQSDGKIIVGGQQNAGGEINGLLIRYNANGSLDSTFPSGSGPIVNFSPGDDDSIVDVEALADGTILVAVRGPVTGDFIVAKFDEDGDLDPTFGTGGIATVGTAAPEQASELFVAEDGSIYVAGETSTGAIVARLLDDGTIDTSFGNSGTGISDVLFAGFATGLDAQTTGQIIVGGTNGADILAARLDAAGALDNTFGTSGVATIDLGAFESANDLVIQSDDAIVIAGSQQEFPSLADALLLRLNADGSLDTEFGDGGATVTDVDNDSADVSHAVAFQPDGQIVAAGSSDDDYLVVRYQGVTIDDVPDALLAFVVAIVEDLVDSGALSQGEGAVLQQLLLDALQALDAEQFIDAVLAILDFMEETDFLVDAGILTPSEQQFIIGLIEFALFFLGL